MFMRERLKSKLLKITTSLIYFKCTIFEERRKERPFKFDASISQHIHVHTNTDTHIYTQIYIHTHTHTHTHTYIYTHTQIYT